MKLIGKNNKMPASIVIYHTDGEESEIWFHDDETTQGPKYWKPTTLGILVKRHDRTRTIYPWINIRCYTVVPTNVKVHSDDDER